MKRISYLIIVLLLLFANVSVTQSMDNNNLQLQPNSRETNSEMIAGLFMEAGELYKQGNWNSALQKYSMIYQTGIKNHQLFYNMGNCYYRMNRLGFAILFWEKALKIKPKDEQSIQNLEFARLKLIDKFEEPESQFLSKVFEAIGDIFSVDGWAIVLILAAWTGGLFFILARKSTRSTLKRVSIYLAAFFVFVILLLSVITYLNYNAESAVQRGVLIAPRSQIRSGPGRTNPTLFILHEGVKVQIESEQGEWYRISVPNGYNGWIKKSNLGLI